MFSKGRGVRQSDSEALRWCILAGEKGHVGASFNAGVMYESGRGITDGGDGAAGLAAGRAGRSDGDAAAVGGGARGESGGESGGDDLYDRAVAIVAREGKASTSFVQRHLKIGYNRAASIIEQMEKNGVVGPANHVGKREILVGDHSADG